MKIPTFNPKDVDEFQKDIVWALMLAQDQNLSNLIVDLRDNGGGLNEIYTKTHYQGKICLGYATASYLVPDFTANGAYDFKRSPLYDMLADLAAQVSIYVPCLTPRTNPSPVNFHQIIG